MQVCPKQCISFHEDEEGFYYPQVGASCINCGLCNRVCPVQNQSAERTPLKVYAALNADQNESLNSSSGGIFIMLAKRVLEKRGVVFGAKWDGAERVVHGYADDYDGVRAFQGSKYLQSYIGKAYRDAELFLKQGRLVLFSGTPCQIAGLRLYLRKDYEHLLTVDVVCHGTPSPMIWRDWIRAKFSKVDEITSIQHRSKRRGWSDYGLEVRLGKRTFWQYCGNNGFFRLFYSNLSLRPSCYDCPVKCGKSHSDITLGDLWGIHSIAPALNDDKGASSILVNTVKGAQAIDGLGLVNKISVRYDQVVRHNPSICKPSDQPVDRGDFFSEYQRRDFGYLVKKYCGWTLKRRMITNVFRVLKLFKLKFVL